MVDITGKYLGEKRVEMTHGPSGAKLITDAPKDNHGKGEMFSPTDLVAAALGTCALTVMGIFAEARNLDIKGSHFHVKKIMSTAPRKIGELPIEIHLPKHLDNETREKIIVVGNTCPVKMSLHPDIKVNVEYIFDV